MTTIQLRYSLNIPSPKLTLTLNPHCGVTIRPFREMNTLQGFHQMNELELYKRTEHNSDFSRIGTQQLDYTWEAEAMGLIECDPSKVRLLFACLQIYEKHLFIVRYLVSSVLLQQSKWTKTRWDNRMSPQVHTLDNLSKLQASPPYLLLKVHTKSYLS